MRTVMELHKRVTLHLIAAMALLMAVNWAIASNLAELTVGIYRIHAEVAVDDATRERGLMFRTHMPQNDGMLFVFDEAGKYCMWMRNTLIPLSVAFLDSRGRIIKVAEMKPRSEDTHCADKPASYGLEMNAGWFKSKGLGRGATIEGIDKAVTGR
jgi:uncharacterized membrane protein (UPF0127 family)